MQLQHRRWRRVRCGLLLSCCSVLLVLAAGASDQQSGGALGSGACDRTTRTPTARPRTHCITGPGRIDWQAAYDCHRASTTDTHTQRTTQQQQQRAASRTKSSARSRWYSIFRTLISSCICYLLLLYSKFLEIYFQFPILFWFREAGSYANFFE